MIKVEETKELGETIRLDLYRLGSPDRYELDGIQFYLVFERHLTSLEYSLNDH